MVRDDCKHYDPPSGWDGADGCLLRNDWFTPCENCEHYESKNKRTNAMKIRSMTDEELAEFAVSTGQGCPPGENLVECCFDHKDGPVEADCRKCWLGWLREEAEQ